MFLSPSQCLEQERGRSLCWTFAKTSRDLNTSYARVSFFLRTPCAMRHGCRQLINLVCVYWWHKSTYLFYKELKRSVFNHLTKSSLQASFYKWKEMSMEKRPHAVAVLLSTGNGFSLWVTSPLSAYNKDIPFLRNKNYACTTLFKSAHTFAVSACHQESSTKNRQSPH